MKFCEECGAQLEDDMKFCDECGTPVADYEEVPATETSGVQTQNETEQKAVAQSTVNVTSSAGKQPEVAKKTAGNSKKTIVLLAIIIGVLVVVAIVLGIVLLGKGGKGKDPEKQTVTNETVTPEPEKEEEPKTDEKTPEAAVTKEVVDDSKKDESDSEPDEDAYPLLEEFIDVVCSYSDPPFLEGDAWEEYFKGEYDCWVSGEGYTNIVIGVDGHLVNTEEYSYGDPVTGNNLFRDATYGVYTIVGRVGNLEYGFRVTKEKSVYAAELVYVNEYGQFFNALDYTRDGVYMDEGNEANGVVNENTGEWVKITFVPYEDGECWFTFEDFYDGTRSVIVDEILPVDCVSWNMFDNYQDYYTFLWN